jgi:DNA-binding NtrC family response regulator
MAILKKFPWPGNVRELRNAVERLVILAQGSVIQPEALGFLAAAAPAPGGELLTLEGTFQEFKERAEASFIRRQLELHQWNISRTAEALDIQRSHLYTKMKRYGLTRTEGGNEGSSESTEA